MEKHLKALQSADSMLIGHIVNKITTTRFEILIKHEVKKFEYLQVYHKSYGYVLCQLVEIIKDANQTLGICTIVGYPDKDGNTRSIREPFEPNSEVLIAADEFISQVIKLKSSEKGAYIGQLEGREIKVQLDLQRMLTKHIAVLAKSGAGKSYCVGVLLEEIMERGVPLLVIDPHGEYHTLKYKTEEDPIRLKRFGVEAKGYLRRIKLYGNSIDNPDCSPLTLSEEMDVVQLLHLLPKLSPTQEAILYTAAKQLERPNLTGLLEALEMDESPAKFSVMHQIEYLMQTKLFSKAALALNELVQVNRCSILNLRGITPQMQQIVAYKILTDVFEARKKGTIPPFFCVVEEAHNFCPEKNFGTSKAGQILRTIASEGRKFGMGLAIISQRPARVEKSVLSQITTQIILKVTNPNDLKAIGSSVEGLTSESCDEIQNLPIGTAIVTGLVDMPLFVNIRPRRTKHGGEAVDILEQTKGAEFFEEIKEFSEQHIVPLIEPKISSKDIALMHPKDTVITAVQVPALLVSCSGAGQFNLLVEMHEGGIVTNIDNFETKHLPALEQLSPRELQVLEKSFFQKTFTLEGFCAKTGFSPDCKEQFDVLLAKKYLRKKGDTYNVNEKIILSSLSKYSCYSQPQYKASPAQRKLKKNMSADQIKKMLAKFTTVNAVQDCWILKYDVQ